MGDYPDRHSAVLPGAARPPRGSTAGARPEALEQVACVMRVTPAYLESVATFYDMLELHPVPAPHSRRMCAPTSPARCAARTRCSRRSARWQAMAASRQRARLRVPRRVRHSADGECRRRLHRPPRPPRTCPTCSRTCAPDARSSPTRHLSRQPRRRPARQRAKSSGEAGGDAGRLPGPTRRRTRERVLDGGRRHHLLLFDGIDLPGLRTLDVYQQPGWLESMRKALAQEPPARCSTRSKPPGCGVVGARGSRPARRSPSSPRERSSATWCATPTSPSRGPSRTANCSKRPPHMLIEGIVIASYAAGASRSFIYIRGEYVQEPALALEAGDRRSPRGRLHRRGHPRLGSLAVTGAPPRGRGLRRGEETALLDSLEGKRGNPRLKPPFPANQGLYQGPTLINNVETLATVPAIIRAGRRAVRADRGGELERHQAGVGLRSIAAAGRLQIELGIPSRELIYDLAGGPPEGRTGEVLVPRRLLLAGADRGRPRRPLRLRLDGQGGVDAGLRGCDRGRRRDADPRRGAEGREVLPTRVMRQVHPLPRGHQLDGEDARTHRNRRGDPDGPRDHGLGAGAHHRQLPVRAGRRDGDADRLDDRQVPRRVRSPHQEGRGGGGV